MNKIEFGFTKHRIRINDWEIKESKRESRKQKDQTKQERKEKKQEQVCKQDYWSWIHSLGITQHI